MIDAFIKQNGLSTRFADLAQHWYIPLAEQILMHSHGANTPYFVGINGCQGSGKTTLTRFLNTYFKEQGQRVATLSLDDFYLSAREREHVANQQHALFQTRGVPGTHNWQCIHDVLQSLQAGQEITAPTFNKAQDNPFPVQHWQHIGSTVDIVLFEGWCWGVPPQSKEALIEPVNLLERTQDPDAIWRKRVNTYLQNHYQPLYTHMNAWLALIPPSFENVYSWRLQQEHTLRAEYESEHLKAPSGIMSDEHVHHFIQFFQRLTEHAISTMPERSDWVLYLDEFRNVTHAKGL
ncbi:kinase [Aestuariibacter sp. AA17]|uniref:Kinase n=1 Tax=Fluctibacter corallii TaxID=2984329 RepID=A0ABT3AB71_9ALTE|nr:kinase [Aestuariibacter sp. AA17]MCV2885929.1 kinase [Aestuariibacter sp. AA17]